ncbi:DUF433 domain-containing protein [Paenarthrobacter sp. YJN-5]|uniref:DUF433 domain-containing protein n=1 Tax=Paenarthrobacter sp. YJN-5 TaxID=2735316 RepID=UPI001877C1ED|nr:DUF433 domain-containing protein [Paenarthrobacter sp. YJN-5]QOT16512.1 DUF433 domain-containing protein [Paenarthrobacter sp. YJN-5]
MAFPIDLTAVLTGTSVSQLTRWRQRGLVVPEIQDTNPAVYSFRDLVAIRTVAFLRSQISLQKIRKAYANLDPLAFTEHPSQYRFGTDGKSIGVADEEGRVVDLVKAPGQISLFTFEEVFDSFVNRSGREVVNFLRPRAHLEVLPGRVGGWPTVDGTRVTYDTIASLVDNDTITVEEVPLYYPSVSVAGAADALSFDAEVRSMKRGLAA